MDGASGFGRRPERGGFDRFAQSGPRAGAGAGSRSGFSPRSSFGADRYANSDSRPFRAPAERTGLSSQNNGDWKERSRVSGDWKERSRDGGDWKERSFRPSSVFGDRNRSF